MVDTAQTTEWNQLMASNNEIYPIMIDGWALSFLMEKMVVNTKVAAIIDSVPIITYTALTFEVKWYSPELT